MTEPSQYFKGRTVQEQMNEVIGYVDTRSAEVATDAIASDVAQVHQDMLDADADASAAAASAAAAAGTLANAVKKTGEASQSIDGDIDLNDDLNVDGDATFGGTVTVQTPVNNTDAATKKYVDDHDALLVPITNINQYAVGLTGNQTPIAGIKNFVTRIGGIVNLASTRTDFASSRKWYRIAKIPANRSIKFSVNMLHEGGASFGVWDFVAVLAASNTHLKLSNKVGTGYIDAYDVTTSVCVGYDGTDFYLYLYTAAYTYNNVNFEYIASFGNIQNASDIVIGVTEEDPTSTGYTLTYATV